MVWAGLGYGGVTELEILPQKETVNKEKYLNLLQTKLEDCFNATETSILQQDGAPAHTAKVITKYLTENNISYIANWPGNSPDLSPIENLWGILKARIRDQGIATIPKLEVALRDAWGKISKELCEKLIDSFPKRLEEVIKRKGGHCKY